ncbi:MAG: 2,3-bisphosphoglycerate-independent phosphoglycerate mutase [Myxococcota bacterium]|nr:2,3-bisphosphoglycerate-independent phosphoglycerate mutase [Myxococcota bacterium]
MSILTLSRGEITPISGPLLTVVLDGVGLREGKEGNALHAARTPTLDRLLAQPHLSLTAHGPAVGLPSWGDMGNSEVGHNALGAGRVFEQGASLVERAIREGTIFTGESWRWLIDGVRESGEALHLIGLLSDGNVHSHEAHLHQLLRRAAKEGVDRARVHILLDGRDVSEGSALTYVDRLEACLQEINNGRAGVDYRIASGGGRMRVTMDRYEADWAMVERGWQAHVLGEAPGFSSARAAILAARDAQPGISDQQLPSFVVRGADGTPVGPIRDGASVCFFNFRGDRAIEISRAFEEGGDFQGFERAPVSVRYAGMMQYDGDLQLPRRFLVDPPAIDRSLGAHLAANGVSQYACSETQKYGHVTYFWNGNKSGAFDPKLERYEEIRSDDLPFEERPWMKAAEITDATLRALQSGEFRAARINYANGDMVGHTGDFAATVMALETVDWALARLLRGLATLDGVALVTADHGNAEEMFELEKGSGAVKRSADGRPRPKTSHSLNPVPLCLFDPRGQVPGGLAWSGEGQPGLASVAATSLELLGFKPPEDYAPSLLGKR